MIDKSNFARVEDAQLLESTGPWNSKSGGVLRVSFSIDETQTKSFQRFDALAFSEAEKGSTENIRGLRVYSVSNIPKGSVGAKEYHLARTEIINVLDGVCEWRLEDIYGGSKVFMLDTTKSLIIPHGILHTYIAAEENTRIQVICNTLFMPDNPGTHDSYMIDDFRRLQEDYRSTQQQS
jgi:dTDP-4-dehydrorhamnose 3,5-epimerase-like enzyme